MVGAKRDFSFQAVSHVEVGEKLGMFDFETGRTWQIWLTTRNSHSPTSQLNLSLSYHCNLLKPPNVSLETFSRQTNKCTNVSPCSPRHLTHVEPS